MSKKISKKKARKIKAIMLVAGKSTRTFPLTENKPKALLDVAGTTIIEHNLEQISGFVDEVILIVGYKKEMINNRLGKTFGKLKLTYVEQKKQLGTGDAVKYAKNLAGEHFFVLMGDDLIFKEDISECVKNESAILVQEVRYPSQYGICSFNDEKNLSNIDEKPAKPKSNLANTGFYLLTSEIFSILDSLKPSKRGEYELTDGVNKYAKKQKVRVVSAKKWVPITYPWHILDANEYLLNELDCLRNKISGKVEKGAVLKGKVSVGKGTLIKAGAYIEGPVYIGENCNIGPNCYIRAGSVIGDNCKVGNAVEIKNSSLSKNVSVGHLSYIGDSVVGENVNFGAGTITANLKHDNGNVKSVVKGKLIDSGRRKLGTIIGDNVHTGIHTSIYPGRKIFSSKDTKPGSIVVKDIE